MVPAPGPECPPLLTVTPHFVCPDCPYSVPTPWPAAFLEGGRDQPPPHPGLSWFLAREPPGGWPDLAGEMWEIGPGTIFAKATKLKARLGRLGTAVCTGGSAGLTDAFLLLRPERDIVSDSSDGAHIVQTNPLPAPVPALNRGGDCHTLWPPPRRWVRLLPQGESETSKYSLEIKAGRTPPASNTPSLSALEMPFASSLSCAAAPCQEL